MTESTNVEDRTINHPDVIAEVGATFLRYETALLANDLQALNDFFWNSATTVRYGVAEQSYGFTEIRDYRQHAPAVHPQRRLDHTVITSFGRDVASVCTEFFTPDSALRGRQSQTWVRFANGWKIVAAHVSAV